MVKESQQVTAGVQVRPLAQARGAIRTENSEMEEEDGELAGP